MRKLLAAALGVLMLLAGCAEARVQPFATVEDVTSAATRVIPGECGEHLVLLYLNLDSADASSYGLFLAETGRLVLVGYDRAGEVDYLWFGRVEDSKLVIESERPLDPVEDAGGPCPALFPEEAPKA